MALQITEAAMFTGQTFSAVSHPLRYRDTGSLEYVMAASPQFCPHGPGLTIHLDIDFLKCDQISLDVLPLKGRTLGSKTTFQFLEEHQGQDRAEHMPAYCPVIVVVDQACSEHGLHRLEPWIPEKLYQGKYKIS